MTHDTHGWWNLCAACQPPHAIRVWRRTADIGRVPQPTFDDEDCQNRHVHRVPDLGLPPVPSLEAVAIAEVL